MYLTPFLIENITRGYPHVLTFMLENYVSCWMQAGWWHGEVTIGVGRANKIDNNVIDLPIPHSDIILAKFLNCILVEVDRPSKLLCNTSLSLSLIDLNILLINNGGNILYEINPVALIRPTSRNPLANLRRRSYFTRQDVRILAQRCEMPEAKCRSCH